jgi:hypothetical protein
MRRDGGILYRAVDMLNERVDAWRRAMGKVATLSRVSPEVQDAFLEVWIESKMSVAPLARGVSACTYSLPCVNAARAKARYAEFP